jgi:NDP-sugar pyrophosphorylase family protein
MTDAQGSGLADLMPVLILAGGLATRLRPLTDKTPKALIEVAGHPFLWHQLQLLKQQGAGHVVLAVGYLGERIQETFGDGAELGLRIEYSFDGPKLLGTGGAIRKALHLLPESFFVLYGDSYLTCNYHAVQNAFVNSRRLGLMTVFHNEGRYEGSNVEYLDGRILRYDKKNRTPGMRHIDYGLGIFDRRAFAAVGEGQPYDLACVYQDLLAGGELAAFEVQERFYEIGSPEGLREASEFLKRADFPG